MRYLVKYTVFALALGLGLSSCQKDYDATPDVAEDAPNPIKGTFTCTQNGYMFKAETKSKKLEDNVWTVSGVKYADSRDSGAFEMITLLIPNYSGAKRYPVNTNAEIIFTRSTADGFISTYRSVGNDNYFIDLSAQFKGTFQATVVNVDNPDDRFVIENGKFDLE